MERTGREAESPSNAPRGLVCGATAGGGACGPPGPAEGRWAP